MSQDAGAAQDYNPADYSILSYDPSIAGAVVFAALYLLVAAGSYWHIHRRRTWYLLALPIGAVFSAVGWLIRIGIRSNPSSVPIFAVQQLFIVCAPAAFFAFNYISYGRFVAHERSKLAPGEHCAPQLSLLPERLTGRIFITVDVVTFLVQGAGGGMQSTQGMQDIGDTIFLIGIVVQGIGYMLFTCTAGLANYRLAKWRRDAKAGRPFFTLIYISSVFIWTRVIFRTIEAAEGYSGKLFQTEIYLFVLDALMLILAMGIYLLPRCWLARFWLDDASHQTLPGQSHLSSHHHGQVSHASLLSHKRTNSDEQHEMQKV